METLRGEVTVQYCARVEVEKGMEAVRKVKGVFEAFLRSSFLAGDGEKRGATSVPGPRSFSFRPASAKVRTVPLNVSLRKLFVGCLSVCQDLMRAVTLFDELRELKEHPDLGDAAEEVLRIYTDSKEIFDMFAEENSLQWEGLMQSLEERVRTVKLGPIPEVEVDEQVGAEQGDEELESSLVETQWKVF